MACLDTSFLLDVAGRGGRQLKARAREKLASLVEGGEALATTRFNVAELWVGVERTRDRQGRPSSGAGTRPIMSIDTVANVSDTC